MTTPTPNVEVKTGEGMVLRREARAALSGRVPVVLSIAVALMCGLLGGYSLRAFTADANRDKRFRVADCPVVILPPSSHTGRHGPARIYLLGHESEPAAAAESAPAARKGHSGGLTDGAAEPPAVRKGDSGGLTDGQAAKAPAARKRDSGGQAAKAPVVLD